MKKEFKQVSSWIDNHQQEMVEFLLEFGNISSPPGHEYEASEFLHQWLSDEGFDTKKQLVTEERSNVISTIPGSGNGEDLLFNAHLDTAYGNPEIDNWTVGKSDPVRKEAWREGDFLFGDDIVNDKGPLSAFVWAALALSECDINLSGNLHLTGVIGEISSATVDEYQDTKYHGAGIGTKHLVESGISADYALVAEMTGYSISQMECGVLWLKITINGNPAYQPTVPDMGSGEPSVVEKVGAAIKTLNQWEEDYRKSNTIQYNHGTNRPSAGIGAIRTGHPVQPSSSPGTAAIYYDVRLPPGKRPEFVLNDLSDLLQSEIGSVEIEPYLFRMGHIADREDVSTLVKGIEEAHERVKDKPTTKPKPHDTSMWRDSNIFNEYGIPSVNFGPGRPSGSEHYIDRSGFSVEIGELVDTAKIYAATAIEICDINQEVNA